MNELAKLYQLVINRELSVARNQVLDTTRIRKKLLAFIGNVSDIGELAHIYTFWDQDTKIVHEDLLDTYIEGVTMIMSIGYEIRIDDIKPLQEIPANRSLDDLMFDIFQDVVVFKNTYDPIIYQNLLDDYFHLGFRLGITLEEIVDSYE